eukprot:COSAG01_NODE_1356_length_10592_cov_4.971995_10_plen_46_part_00
MHGASTGAQYDQKGVVVLEGVLSAEEVEAAHADAEALLSTGALRP